MTGIDPEDVAIAPSLGAEKPVTFVEEQKPGEKMPEHSENKNKLGFMQAVAMNTLQMFGTGPFVTIPFCIAAVETRKNYVEGEPAGGPHALIGYSVAILACMCDSLIWGELGSQWPVSGGTYVYLKQCFGAARWGRMCSFLYVWAFMIAAPMEVAAGFIAFAQYVAYVTGVNTFIHHSLVACGFCLLCVGLLARKVDDIGRVATVLWVVMIGAILTVLVVGFTNFHPTYFNTPSYAFLNPMSTARAIGVSCQFAVYDMTGYYEVCNMGAEVQNPKRTIPYSCVLTCAVVGVINILCYIAIMGTLHWEEFTPLAFSGDDTSNYIVAMFMEKVYGVSVGTVAAVVVAISIFGSNFSMMCGFAYVPYAAAKDGYFFRFLAGKKNGTPYASLLTLGFTTCACCFFDLGILIEGLVTMIVFVQFVGQAVGLLVYRWRTPVDKLPEGFKVPLYPLPVLVQLTMFVLILLFSPNWCVSGQDPVLDLAFLYLLVGVGVYLIWSKKGNFWPWADVETLAIQDDLQEELFQLDLKMISDADSTDFEKASVEIRKRYARDSGTAKGENLN